MTKHKKKPTNPPIEYIPVINKQLRWVVCRQIAEKMYHSELTDDQIAAFYTVEPTKYNYPK